MEPQTENNLEKVDLAAHEAPEAQAVPSIDVISQFNEVLGKNLDRLLGASHGIESLPLNMFTVSCLILLATRETEIEGFPYLPPERYTHESLLKDMSDMNIEHGGDLEEYIGIMLDKGYIKVETDGRLFPGTQIMKMAALFDRIFPKMPGLNLVAYLGQMIDEVLSDRKPLNVALNQFDQMLTLQGASMSRDSDSISTRDASKAFPHLKVADTVQPVKRKTLPADVKPSDIFSKLQTKAWTVPQPKVAPRISSLDSESTGMRDNEIQADLVVKGDTLQVSRTDSEKEIQEQTLELRPSDLQEKAGKGIDPEQPVISDGHDMHLSSTDEPAPVRGYEQDFNPEYEDDDVEKKIAAFQEQLSMACPLCRTSGIVPLTTAKGKAYYKCSSEDCNFISWGKPYYISCPKCKNSFLIETQDSQGNMMLKCPRTTCIHWQKFPWEQGEKEDNKSSLGEQPDNEEKRPRRVVRRRKKILVRRKS